MRDRLTDLIEKCCCTGEFDTDNPESVALKILVIVDGLNADLNADPQLPPSVFHMIYDVVEPALGLAPGALRSPGSS